jgi:hypothetical protein
MFGGRWVLVAWYGSSGSILEVGMTEINSIHYI